MKSYQKGHYRRDVKLWELICSHKPKNADKEEPEKNKRERNEKSSLREVTNASPLEKTIRRQVFPTKMEH